MKTTPLVIHSSILLDDATRKTVRVRLGRWLAKYASSIERATVRFEDVNGPRGAGRPATGLELEATLRTRSPKARATRARVRRPS